MQRVQLKPPPWHHIRIAPCQRLRPASYNIDVLMSALIAHHTTRQAQPGCPPWHLIRDFNQFISPYYLLDHCIISWSAKLRGVVSDQC